MSLLFRNLLDEGFYEKDDYGDLTRIDDPDKIIEAKKDGRLYESDGMSTTKVDDVDYEKNF